VRLRGCGLACGTTAEVEGNPVKIVKRIVLVLVIAFAAFYLITRPQDAANAVQGAVGAVAGAVMAVVDFFVALAAG
jgi:hypothetical protein